MHEQKFTKTFNVDEYILPTFSVDILLPPYATIAKPDVIATVKAAYTYGKPVKGDVTLTVQSNGAYYHRSIRIKQIKAQLDSDGSVDISVSIVHALNWLSSEEKREVKFTAEVEETLTGKKYEQSSVIKIYREDYKVELIKTANSFKPGLKYVAFFKVAHQDNTPVADGGAALKVMYGFSYNDSDWTKVIETVPQKGVVRVDIVPPLSSNVIGWEAEYYGHKYYFENVTGAQSPSNSFIQLVLKSDQNQLEKVFGAKSATVGQENAYQVANFLDLGSLHYLISPFASATTD